jgi:hypothetical protein
MTLRNLHLTFVVLLILLIRIIACAVLHENCQLIIADSDWQDSNIRFRNAYRLSSIDKHFFCVVRFTGRNQTT